MKLYDSNVSFKRFMSIKMVSVTALGYGYVYKLTVCIITSEYLSYPADNGDEYQ